MITNSIAYVEWGDVWAMTGIGFGVVFCVLLLLVFALFALGYAVSLIEGTAKKKAAPAPVQQVAQTTAPSAASASDADKAAIATALYLYYQNVHDEESDVITIKRDPNSHWHHELNKHF